MFLPLLLVGQPTYYDAEAKVAVSSYPKWQLEQDLPGALTFRNTTDGSSLSVLAYKAAGADLDKAWAIHTTTNSYSKGGPEPFSGIPLGTHVYSYESTPVVRLYARSGDTFATIYLGRRGVGPRGNVSWHAHDREGDRTDVEGVARRLIALVEDRYSTSTGTTRIGGRNLAKRRGRGGQEFVPLSDWCDATGVALAKNERLGTASFTRNGDTYIVALGARKFKVGANWVDFGDTVLLHGSKWFVPLSVLPR